jgi:hypothetical protein
MLFLLRRRWGCISMDISRSEINRNANFSPRGLTFNAAKFRCKVLLFVLFCLNFETYAGRRISVVFINTRIDFIYC